MKDKKNRAYVLPGTAIGLLVIVMGTVQGIIGGPSERYVYASYAGYIYHSNWYIGKFGSVYNAKEESNFMTKDHINDRNKILYIICPCYNEEENLGGIHLIN